MVLDIIAQKLRKHKTLADLVVQGAMVSEPPEEHIYDFSAKMLLASNPQNFLLQKFCTSHVAYQFASSKYHVMYELNHCKSITVI